MNEPAFPHSRMNEENGAAWTEYYDGLSIRDYFAAHATEEDVQAWIPRTQGEANQLCEEVGIPKKMPALRCWARYKHADAMLTERERKRS